MFFFSFLECLEELTEAHDRNLDEKIKAYPELVKDSSLLGYRNNRQLWATFPDVLSDFQFLHQGYLLNLDDKIRKRPLRQMGNVSTVCGRIVDLNHKERRSIRKG